ncbi:Na+/H+ antiporter [Erwinia endophytica]|uniref:Na+/H+ antiporter n=1 Tax=Erwinia endophytica TaxID=1563158 RepID=UPI001265D899|nr:Na+/H+ antiporter [Erwinia endophytica]KAB8307408.1 Na+/H+ antiporter [Erwinia endophytica]
MESVFTILVLLTTVGLSGFVTRVIALKLPLPLIQILLGCVLAWPGFSLHVTFDPEFFMMLFIPPLLFADAWRIPKREFFRQRGAILALALGLALVTVPVIGYSVHALIPAIPLSVAFALAAVLAPTDAVALSGIAGKGAIPSNLRHILEGEALMNDASGLVALRFAIAAAMTGVFSLRHAFLSFVMIAVGGLAIGAAIGWLSIVLSSWFKKRASDEDPAAGVIMMLLLPFAAYLSAERAGCSGILAAVAAGMMMNYQSLRADMSIVTRLRIRGTWGMIEFVFNGMTFILLGLQLPHIIGSALIAAEAQGYTHMVVLIGYVLLVLMMLHLLRFGWMWGLRWLARRRRQRNATDLAVSGWRPLIIMTLGGVRGAVTLAGALSLPILLPDGMPFPGREMAIFIASGTILCSLLVAIVGLPMVLHGVSGKEDGLAAEERYARIEAAQAAIRALAETHDQIKVGLDESATVRVADCFARVMDLYRRHLEVLGADQTADEMARLDDQVDIKLRTRGLQAQRAELLRLRRRQKINDETLNKLLAEIDLAEAALFTRSRTV